MWCLFRDNSWLHSYNQVWKRQLTILRLTHSDLNFSVVAVKKLKEKCLASFITHIFSFPESILQSSTLLHFSLFFLVIFLLNETSDSHYDFQRTVTASLLFYSLGTQKILCVKDPSLTKHLTNWCIMWANLISRFDQNILYTLCLAITPQMLLMIGTLSQYHSYYVFIHWYYCTDVDIW